MTAEQMKYEFEVGYDRITNFDAPGYEPKEISTFLTKAQEELTYDLLEDNAYREIKKKAFSKLKDMFTLSSFDDGSYSDTGNNINSYVSNLVISLSGTTLGFNSGSGYITDSGNGFIDAGFRVGDRITVSGATTSANNGSYTIAAITAGQITISGSETIDTTESGIAATKIVVDPVLAVRNEVAKLTVGSTSVYNGKLTEIEGVNVDPVDDDYYHSNVNNPFKKPNEKRIWRVDYGDNDNKKHEYIVNDDYTLDSVKVFFIRTPRPIIIADSNYSSDGMIDGEYFDDYTSSNLNCELNELTHREIVDRAVKLAYAALQDEKGFQISSAQEQQK